MVQKSKFIKGHGTKTYQKIELTRETKYQVDFVSAKIAHPQDKSGKMNEMEI